MKLKYAISYVALLLLACSASAGLAAQIYMPVTSIICEIYWGVMNICGALAAAVFMIAGIKWVSSRDDAGARNSARTTMVHAIAGLIVVLLAKVVVLGITTTSLSVSAICAP